MEHKDYSGSKAADLFSLILIILLSFAFFWTLPANTEIEASPAFSLIGTIQGEHLSGAVLQDTTGEQSFFPLFEKLPDGSQVVKVRPDSILLRGSDGINYEMFIVHGAKSVGAVRPSSPADPYAGTVRKAPEERPLRPYERRRQNRHGIQTSDDE